MSLLNVASLGYGGAHLNDSLPKIIAELQGLTISGPSAGETANGKITVADGAGIDIQDTLLKVLYFPNAGGAPTDVTSVASIVDRRAQIQLDLSGVVTGDKVVVHGKTYTAVTFTASPTNGQVGPYNFAAAGAFNTAQPPVWVCDDVTTAANLAKAIMSADPALTCLPVDGYAEVQVWVRAAGVAGNAYTVSVAGSNSHISEDNDSAVFYGGSATNSIAINSDTSAGTVLVFWYQKSRLIGQA